MGAGIEVQRESFELLSRTMMDMAAAVEGAVTYSRTCNSSTIIRVDHSRILCVHHLDLRHLACNPVVDVTPLQFHVLTANPPYLEIKAGTMGKDAQRNSARFEVHGSIYHYCAAARQLLRPTDGLFYVVHLTRCDDRVRDACRLHGLTIAGVLHVVAGTSCHLLLIQPSIA